MVQSAIPGLDSYAFIPHCLPSNMMQLYWWNDTWIGPRSNSLGGQFYTSAPTPLVRVDCTEPFVLESDPQFGTRMPTFPQYAIWDRTTTQTVNFSTEISDFLTKPPLVSEASVTTFWLPYQARMGYATGGVVAFGPRLNSSFVPRQTFSCTVDARWMPSNLQKVDGDTDIVTSAQLLANMYSPHPDVRQIEIDDEWMASMNPQVPIYNDDGTTSGQMGSALSSLFMAVDPDFEGLTTLGCNYYASPVATIETVITTYLADGLSRIGTLNFALAHSPTYWTLSPLSSTVLGESVT